jgi:hypothetical protein
VNKTSNDSNNNDTPWNVAMVTRLGEVSPNGWLFTLGSCFKLQKQTKILATSSPGYLATLNVSRTNCWIGNETSWTKCPESFFMAPRQHQQPISLEQKATEQSYEESAKTQLHVVGYWVARWYIFKPKNPNLGKILEGLAMIRWYFTAIWYVFPFS